MSIQARPLSFADQVCQNNKKTTKLKNFLDAMDKVVPWDEFIARIEPSLPSHRWSRSTALSIANYAAYLSGADLAELLRP